MGEAHQHHRHREDTMTRPRRRPLALVNAFTRWILHVPLLRRLADRQVCELRFAGVRTGRPVVLPVMYARRADRVVVLVGGADQKTWWRNFARPTAVRVLLAGTTRTGTGHVVGAASPERADAAKIYATRFRDIPVEADPMVVIDLDP
jgi:F420H(2)-dependent quinone reductase